MCVCGLTSGPDALCAGVGRMPARRRANQPDPDLRSMVRTSSIGTLGTYKPMRLVSSTIALMEPVKTEPLV